MKEKKHPSFDITGTRGKELSGKKIVLCVTGSVAAVNTPDLARLLMRHGAEVYPVMSESSCRIIHPDMMHWATGNTPVTAITGAVEHVELAGNTDTKADLLMIAPCTANTAGKIASGIDDTAVTTFVTTALGEGIPLLVVPAMHEPMYNHPFVRGNLDKLESAGVVVLRPRVEEGKAKIPENTVILNKVISMLSPDRQLLGGKKILVTAGRSVEYIDPVRVITNNSSGRMGISLAEKALRSGADVTLVAGKISVKPPAGIRVLYAETAKEMFETVHKELESGSYDIFAAAAAVGDWQMEKPFSGKVSTHTTGELVLKLKPTPKIIDSIREKYPDLFIVAFRALHGMDEAELLDNAEKRMKKAGADMIAVNDVSVEGAGFETDTNEMFIITSDGESEKIPMAAKGEVAQKIIKKIAAELAGRGNKKQ